MSWERGVREWVERACAIVDGVTADYIAVHVKAGPKSWPEHASVRVESRAPADVVEEVVGHVRDVSESTDAEGRAGWAVRLKLYRAKSPAGSKTFSSAGTAPAGSDPESDDDGAPTRAGEVACVVRDLRHTVVHLAGELSSQATHGWQLAAKQHETMTAQAQRIAQLEAQLALAQGANADDPMAKAAAELVPQIPAIIAGFQAAAAAREAMKG